MAEILVVRSKVKDAAKGMHVAGDFADSLSAVLESLVRDAEARCQENKRSTVMSKDLAYNFVAAKKVADMLIVRSKVKETIKKCNVAGDFADSLNRVAWHLVKEACRRAGDNKRSTVQSRDL